MSNESSANFTIKWDPNNHFGSNQNFQILKDFICLVGSLTDDYYGIDQETWNDMISDDGSMPSGYYGTGRWSFSSSISKLTVLRLLTGLLYPNAVADESEYNISNRTTYIIENLSLYRSIVPYRDSIKDITSLDVSEIDWYDDSIITQSKNIFILASITNDVRRAIDKLKSITNIIPIMHLEYNDYEPGVNFLEINGTADFILDTDTHRFSIIQDDGDVINSPTTDQLYEHSFAEYSTEDLTKNFYEETKLETIVHQSNELILKNDQDTILQWQNCLDVISNQFAVIQEPDTLDYNELLYELFEKFEDFFNIYDIKIAEDASNNELADAIKIILKKGIIQYATAN